MRVDKILLTVLQDTTRAERCKCINKYFTDDFVIYSQ